jgi:tripartite-type tricarboxylate transporter receptor subunit TctC
MKGYHMEPARRRFLQLVTAAITLPIAPLALARDYPTRAVRVIVPVAPGGANDTTTRLVMQKLSESLRQQFYVENQAGAGGNIGMGLAARAPADGYTVLAAASSFVINPNLYGKIPYDPAKDFAPVTLVCSTPHVLVVHPSLAASNVKELIGLVKANPGKFSYASAGTGTPAHLAGELFRISFDLDLIHVPFGGGGPAMTSAIGGHTPIAFSALSTAAPNVKAGTVRALGMMSDKRSAVLPDVPTMAEAGAPGQEAVVITGILVPAATPKEIVELLHGEIVKAMMLSDVRERLASLGFDPVTDTPEEFAQWIGAEISKWGRVIRAAGIGVQ